MLDKCYLGGTGELPFPMMYHSSSEINSYLWMCRVFCTFSVITCMANRWKALEFSHKSIAMGSPAMKHASNRIMCGFYFWQHQTHLLIQTIQIVFDAYFCIKWFPFIHWCDVHFVLVQFNIENETTENVQDVIQLCIVETAQDFIRNIQLQSTVDALLECRWFQQIQHEGDFAPQKPIHWKRPTAVLCEFFNVSDEFFVEPISVADWDLCVFNVVEEMNDAADQINGWLFWHNENWRISCIEGNRMQMRQWLVVLLTLAQRGQHPRWFAKSIQRRNKINVEQSKCGIERKLTIMFDTAWHTWWSPEICRNRFEENRQIVREYLLHSNKSPIEWFVIATKIQKNCQKCGLLAQMRMVKRRTSKFEYLAAAMNHLEKHNGNFSNEKFIEFRAPSSATSADPHCRKRKCSSLSNCTNW